MQFMSSILCAMNCFWKKKKCKVFVKWICLWIDGYDLHFMHWVLRKYQTICFLRKSFWKSLLVSQKCTFARVPASVLFRRISPMQRLRIHSQNPCTKSAPILWTRAVFSAVCNSWRRVWGPNHLNTVERLWQKSSVIPTPKKNLRRKSFVAEGARLFDSMAVESWIMSIVGVVYSSLTPIFKRDNRVACSESCFSWFTIQYSLQ